MTCTLAGCVPSRSLPVSPLVSAFSWLAGTLAFLALLDGDGRADTPDTLGFLVAAFVSLPLRPRFAEGSHSSSSLPPLSSLVASHSRPLDSPESTTFFAETLPLAALERACRVGHEAVDTGVAATPTEDSSSKLDCSGPGKSGGFAGTLPGDAARLLLLAEANAAGCDARAGGFFVPRVCDAANA